MTIRPTPKLLLALAISGFVTLTGGCDQMEADSRKADRTVQKSVDAAWEKLKQSETSGLIIDPKLADKADADKFAAAKKKLEERRKAATDGKQNAIKDLEAAVKETNASLTEKLEAKSLLAATELALAEDTLVEVHRITPVIRRKIWEIQEAGARLASVNAAVAALEGRNPQATIAGFGTSRKTVTDAGDSAAGKAKQLMDQVAAIDAKIKELTTQRDAANTQADADAQKATALSGKEANDLLNGVNENRKKAALLGHEIDKLMASKLPLERDAAIEMAKKTAADAAAASVDATKTGTESEWTAVQGMIADQKKKAKEIAAEITAKSDELATLVKTANEHRAKASGLLTKSALGFKSTATDAGTLGRQLQGWEGGESPEKVAWKSLRETYHPSIFMASEAQANHTLASMNLALASELAARQAMVTAVKAALDGAQEPAPASLGSVDAELKKAEDEAKKNFTDAVAQYKSAGGYETAQDNLTNERFVGRLPKIGHALALYGQSLLPGGGQVGDAKALLKSAMEEDGASDRLLKALPESIRPAAVTPTPTPTPTPIPTPTPTPTPTPNPTPNQN